MLAIILITLAAIPSSVFAMLAIAAKRAPIYYTSREVADLQRRAEEARALAQRVAL